MKKLSKKARIVGLWYLLWSLVGLPSLIYIPSKLYVSGDAVATATNIAAHQTLFQFGIATDLVGSVMLIVLVLAFYSLFKDVSRYQAAFLAITGGILPAAVSFASAANSVATLILIRGPDYLNVFSEAQRDALAYFFTRVSFGVTVGEGVLWGVWLFPMASLILKSRWVPRFIGWWLVISGVFYIALSYTGMFMPQYYKTVANYLIPFGVGEIALILWLLIMGAKEGVVTAPATQKQGETSA